MKFQRLLGAAAAAGLVTLLSGCVVAPVGYGPRGAYVEPAAVVVPQVNIGYGYYGRGYYGHRGYWR